MMIDAVDARQPVRVAWSPEKLFRKRAFAMEHALDKSSKKILCFCTELLP
jgi:hypothetical protein